MASKSQPYHPHNKTPIGFLSLPHELRQQILLQTMDETFTAVINLDLNDENWSNHYQIYSYHAQLFATDLKKVDQQIVGDVDYVEEKWNKRFARIFEAKDEYDRREEASQMGAED